MLDVAAHANSVSPRDFGSLAPDAPARKLSASAPVMLLPAAIVVLGAAAVITAIGSI
jgi:hypothetical protein